MVECTSGTGDLVIGSVVAGTGPTNGVIGAFHLEPRCRVCRTDDMRQKVNSMLAAGCSYAGIVRSLITNNADLPNCDRVSVDSVRNHAARHFPVQNLAQATYREILQQRAQQNQIDIADGLATALTPMAFMEAVMAKSFATLAQGDTEVAVETGLRAAHRLQAVLDAHASQPDLAKIRLDVNKITEAVRSTVPESMWAEIRAKLTDPVHPPHDQYNVDDGDDDEEHNF